MGIESRVIDRRNFLWLVVGIARELCEKIVDVFESRPVEVDGIGRNDWVGRNDCRCLSVRHVVGRCNLSCLSMESVKRVWGDIVTEAIEIGLRRSLLRFLDWLLLLLLLLRELRSRILRRRKERLRTEIG